MAETSDNKTTTTADAKSTDNSAITETTEAPKVELPNPEEVPEGAGNARNEAFWAESEAGKAHAAGEKDRQKAYDAEAKAFENAEKARRRDPVSKDFRENDPATNDEGHNPNVKRGAAVLPSDQSGVTQSGLGLNQDGTTRPL